MKKILFFISLLFIILTSCQSGKEKSKEVVREYISDIQNEDWSNAKNLVYYHPYNNDVLRIPYEEIKSSINTGERSAEEDIYNINTWRNVRITTIDTIEVREYNSNVDWVMFGNEKVHNPYIPENVKSTYCVRVKSGENNVDFIVVKTIDKQYKIYGTYDLLAYDLKGLAKRMGCEIQLMHDDPGISVPRCLNELKVFNTFSDAVAANDSSTVFNVFSALKGYNTSFKNKPVPIKYQQLDNNISVITCADSTAYKISNNEIIDCYGVVSFDDIIKDIESLDEEPLGRQSNYDIEYSRKLNKQKQDIIAKRKRIEEEKRKENERKARAAKYQSQGVALVSSNFSYPIPRDGNTKGVQYTALNTSNKTAKYIIIEVVGYNVVDDPVRTSDGSYFYRGRGIGPIAPGQTATWDFNKIWDRGELVDSYEIKTLTIEFNDGTSKRVKLPQNLPSDWRSWLY